MGKTFVSGQRFGRLTVISLDEQRKVAKRNYWLCQCDCGNMVSVSTENLNKGQISSCGCLRKEQAKNNNPNYEDLSGKRFGLLTVLNKSASSKQGVLWDCLCDCGNRVTVSTHHLKSGIKRSCGCVNNRLYCVYKHVSPDGKVYVGTTARLPYLAWFSGAPYSNQSIFKAVIEEIGGYKQFKVLFKHFYLDQDENWIEITSSLPFETTNQFKKSQAGDLVKKYVEEYKTYEPQHGYNACSGRFDGFSYTDDVKNRQSLTRTGKDERTDWKVYIHTNKINKKVYVGITCRDPVIRWQGGHGYKRPRGQSKAISHFMNAINKYGWNNFDHEIIAEGLTLEQASEMERQLIRQYDSTNPDKGYNVAEGGKGTTGAKHSDETKKLLSEKAKKRIEETGIVAFKGRHHSDETKAILSKKAKERIKNGAASSFKGKHHTDETKKILSEQHNKPITMYDLTGKKIKTFPSISVAAEEMGLALSSVSSCANRKTKLSAGRIWRFVDVEQLSPEMMPNLVYGSSKAIEQYSKDGEFIAEYPSLKAGAAAIGVDISSIYHALKKGHKSGGFFWKYKIDQ